MPDSRYRHKLPQVDGRFSLTDGRLPSEQNLGEAIEEVDGATGGGPVYYMINCAHPTHFEDVLDGPWRDLDDGDPQDLGARYAALRDKLPQLNVVGGCCGTDHRHVGEICSAWHA